MKRSLRGRQAFTLERYVYPLSCRASRQLHEMETPPFYEWANQKGGGEGRKQRPHLVSLGVLQAPRGLGLRGWGTREVTGIQSSLCPPAFAG